MVYRSTLLNDFNENAKAVLLLCSLYMLKNLVWIVLRKLIAILASY